MYQKNNLLYIHINNLNLYIFLNKSPQMQTEKPYKSPQEYSKNIKILKYHLQQLIKQNQSLKYKIKIIQKEKAKVKSKTDNYETNVKSYKIDEIAKRLFKQFQLKGIPLSCIFRMADANYEGEISNQDLINIFKRFELNISDQQILQVVFSMDTSLNGKIDEAQYNQFLNTYGVGDDSQQTIKLQNKAMDKFIKIMKDQKMSFDQLFKSIDTDGGGSIDANELRIFLKDKKAKLNENEIFLILNHLDPSKKGEIAQKTFISTLENTSKRQQMKKANDDFQKEMKKLGDKFKEYKINPIQLFQEADVDHVNGVTTGELEDAFRKIFTKESGLQIKKWIANINFNDDKIIQKEQFMNAIKAIYSTEQIMGMGTEYNKKKSKIQNQKTIQENTNKLLKQFSQKIQDMGKTKKQVFKSIDKNGDNIIDISEFSAGLKNLGLHIGLVNNLMKIFDKDNSGSISLNQFYKILGEDVEFSDVQIEQPKIDQPEKNKKLQKKQTKSIIKKKETKKQTKKQIEKNSSKKKIQQTKNITKSITKNIEKKQTKKQEENYQEQEVVQEEIKNNYLDQKQLQPYHDKIVDLYRRNKDKLLAYFYNYDKKKTGIISEQSFCKVVGQILNLKEDDNTKKHILQSLYFYAQTEMAVKYILWLDQITENSPIKQQTGVQKNSKFKRTNSIIENVQKSEKKSDSNRQSMEKKSDKESIEKKSTKNPMKESLTKLQKTQNLSKKPPIVPEKGKLDKKQTKSQSNQKLLKKQSKIIDNKKKIDASQKQKQKQVSDSKIQLPNESILDIKKNIPEDKRGAIIDSFYDFVINVVDQNKQQNKIGKSNLLNYIDYDQDKVEQFYRNAQKIKSKKSLYRDPIFPPTKQSITKNISKIPESSLMKWQHFTKIFSKPCVFKDKIQPGDIKQGSLGDCYFLSSLACLSEYAHLIQRLFQYQDNQNGFYGIWICIDGIWTLISVDGWIPCKADGKTVAFSQSVGEELWVILLQKAYAKAYGSYEQISGGATIEAIRDISGAPGKYFRHDDNKLTNEKLSDILNEANKNQYMITAGTDPHRKGIVKEGKAQNVTLTGIVLGHAYSILDVREINGEVIIQLRNPWGAVEWNGDWSDKSSKWTPQTKKILNYNDKDDGIFWMPLLSFRKQFQVTCINYIRPNYHYKTIVNQDVHKEFFVKCENFTHGYITISQKDLRHQLKREGKMYQLLQMIAVGIQKNKITRVIKQQNFGYTRDSCLEITLDHEEELGIYVSLGKQCECNINYYGKQKIQFAVQKNVTIIDDILSIMVPQEGFNQSKDCKYFTNYFGQFFYFCIFNLSKNKLCEFSVQMDSVQNMNIEPPFKNNMKWSVSIKPTQNKIIKYKRVDPKQSYGSQGFLPRISFR